MRGKLLLQTAVVLFDFIGEDGRLRHEHHSDVRGLVHVLRRQFWKRLLLLVVLLKHPLAPVGVQEPVLLSHGQVHGLLTEEAQDGGRGFARAGPPQDEQVLDGVQDAHLALVELHVDDGQHLEYLVEPLAPLKPLQSFHGLFLILISSRVVEVGEILQLVDQTLLPKLPLSLPRIVIRHCLLAPLCEVFLRGKMRLEPPKSILITIIGNLLEDEAEVVEKKFLLESANYLVGTGFAMILILFYNISSQDLTGHICAKVAVVIL